MATTKKKSRKKDNKLVSKTKGEIGYAAKKTKKSVKVIKAAKKKVGASRKKIEAEVGFTKK